MPNWLVRTYLTQTLYLNLQSILIRMSPVKLMKSVVVADYIFEFCGL